jgi:hypothetical protein
MMPPWTEIASASYAKVADEKRQERHGKAAMAAHAVA